MRPRRLSSIKPLVAGGGDEVVGRVPGDPGYLMGVAGEGGEFLGGVGGPDDAGAVVAGGGDEVTRRVPGDPGHCAGVTGV